MLAPQGPHSNARWSTAVGLVERTTAAASRIVRACRVTACSRARPRERAEATADSRERVQFGTLDAPTLRHRHATRPPGCRAGVECCSSLLWALTYEAVAPIWNRSRCPTPARGCVITAEASVWNAICTTGCEDGRLLGCALLRTVRAPASGWSDRLGWRLSERDKMVEYLRRGVSVKYRTSIRTSITGDNGPRTGHGPRGAS